MELFYQVALELKHIQERSETQEKTFEEESLNLEVDKNAKPRRRILNIFKKIF